jgi:hypothetical protein
MRTAASYTEVPLRGLPFAPVWCFALVSTSCEDEYPLAATFCDDWCRATLRAGCGEEPENCVRDCELTKASEDCFGRHRRLLACYETASDSGFVCAGMGFQRETRVQPGVCQAERDALYECEAPGIGTCLALCRVQQTEQLDRALEGETGLVDFARLALDAGAAPLCPALDQPCESLCFSLLGFSSESLDVALVDSEAYATDAGPRDPAEIRRCIEQALQACFLPATRDAGAKGSSEAEVESIGDVIARCTGFR